MRIFCMHVQCSEIPAGLYTQLTEMWSEWVGDS